MHIINIAEKKPQDCSASEIVTVTCVRFIMSYTRWNFDVIFMAEATSCRSRLMHPLSGVRQDLLSRRVVRDHFLSYVAISVLLWDYDVISRQELHKSKIICKLICFNATMPVLYKKFSLIIATINFQVDYIRIKTVNDDRFVENVTMTISNNCRVSWNQFA